jgi:small-conductance mechanosensitive channel
MTADYCGRLAMYSWASYETLRQYGLARRRVRIGLSEPLVANRFLLWGIGTLAALGIWLHSLWRELAQRSEVTEFYLVVTVLGSTCALSIWLAFFPPRAYRQWFETSAPA